MSVDEILDDKITRQYYCWQNDCRQNDKTTGRIDKMAVETRSVVEITTHTMTEDKMTIQYKRPNNWRQNDCRQEVLVQNVLDKITGFKRNVVGMTVDKMTVNKTS